MVLTSSDTVLHVSSQATQSLFETVVAALAPDATGTLRFTRAPSFVVPELRALTPPVQKEAVRTLASFGHFLAKEKAAPEASAQLMAALEQFAKESER